MAHPIYKKILSILPKEVAIEVRSLFEFAPHDPNKMWQILPQKMSKVAGVDRIEGFRYPSPGSRVPHTRVPVRETEDEVYNIQHYTRDPRNYPSTEITGFNSSKGAVFVDPNVAVSKVVGAKPDGNPAVRSYDPTGLRSARSASWESFDKVIAEAASKTHVPTPVYETELDKFNAEKEEMGVPPTFGRRYKAKFTKNYNEVRW